MNIFFKYILKIDSICKWGRGREDYMMAGNVTDKSSNLVPLGWVSQVPLGNDE